MAVAQKEYYLPTEAEAEAAQEDLLAKCKETVKCDVCDPESENYIGRKAPEGSCSCSEYKVGTSKFSEVRQSKDGYWCFTASPSLSNVYPIRDVDLANYESGEVI